MFLSGGSINVSKQTAPLYFGGGGGGEGGACHLLDCLKDFVKGEIVEGVECKNCGVLKVDKGRRTGKKKKK